MKIKVNKNEIIIDKDYTINQNEYNINKCEFEFSEEYDDLTKKAIFEKNDKIIEVAIIDDECNIPSEVISEENTIVNLRVYAYDIEESEDDDEKPKLITRYSPSYAEFEVITGSYLPNAQSGQEVTPTQFEQYTKALNDGLAKQEEALEELEEVIESIEVDTKYAKEMGDYAKQEGDYAKSKGDDAQTLINNFSGTIQEIIASIPTKVSDLPNDANYINKNVNDLSNYYTKNDTYNKTEINEKLSKVLNYKGSVATYNDLPTTDLKIGDTYNVNDTGKNYAWNGTEWDDLGGTIDLSSYYTKTQSDAKYVQDASYKHTDNNYTTAEKTKLASVEDNAQVNKIEGIIVNGIPQTIDKDKNVNIRVQNTRVYGIKRSLTTTSSSWDRTDDAVGLVANATHDGSAVVNDFDNIYPWSKIYTYNFDTTSQLETAKIGDANFKFDGTNGEVLTKIPEFYLKRYRDENYEYIQISEFPIEGFLKIESFSVGRYDSTLIDGKIHSYSGYTPEVNRNITYFRTLSKQVGANFGQLDWRYFVLQMLYLVEYANYDSQTKLGNGATGFRVNDADKALIAETSVNRILINTSTANSFDVGQQVSIGTSSVWNWSVAQNRTITKKEDYSDGTISGTMVYLDGNPFNVAVNNVLWTTGQKSGICDGLGMKSGCYKTNKNSCIYRGIENLFGNIYQFVDGINIKDYVAYICYDPTQYVVDKFVDPYVALGYTDASKSNSYASKLGYDDSHPLIGLTTAVDGGSNTNMCDYYYCNSGNRIVLVGGNFSSTTTAGLWFFFCNLISVDTAYHVGSRLLRY